MFAGVQSEQALFYFAVYIFNRLQDAFTHIPVLIPIAKLNRGSVRMLVVDDMPHVLLTFSHYAEKLGIPCSTAESAEEALEILQREHHDIIFVDWKMPGMDGLALVKRLGSLSDNQNVVIMISAADWSEVEAEAKSAGVKEFITKPILLPVIENVLEKYCESASCKADENIDDFSMMTILLVDDIQVNREIIILLLEHTGIHVACAENGVEAIEKYSASPEAFDLIFMDVQMPEMDGYEATRRIRALQSKQAREVPIVAMTANVFKEDVERCLACGMNDHVGKPVSPEEIMAKIKQWTKN